MEFIFHALQYIADIFGSISDFITGIPDFVSEVFDYAWYWTVTLWFHFQIQTVDMAYKVAQMFLTDYEVYTLLNRSFNSLPDNMRAISYGLGLVDGIRIIVDALATAFVLRVMGW